MTPKAVKRVQDLPFVTSVNPDPVKQLHTVPAAEASDLPGAPYWLDLIDAEQNTAYDGSGVWVAVLDSGFYPNWRDYFDSASILTEHASAFVAANGKQNANQWDRGSDPHGMAVSATIVGHRFADDTNEGGWGEDYATGSARRLLGAGCGARGQDHPGEGLRTDRVLRQRHQCGR